VREKQGCTELCFGKGDEPAESQWVRLRGQNNAGSTAVGVCYRLPDQEEAAEFVKF